MGKEPEYYKQTATFNQHKLTAVEGQIHDLVWKCRICGETRREKVGFGGMSCE